MKEKIKALLQSTELPIVFATKNPAVKQELFLCQFRDENYLQGHPIPKGTYLLADKDCVKVYKQARFVKVVSKQSIQASVLHYIEEDTSELTVDNSVDLIVTPRLTGCTVAAELNSSTPTLLHINRRLMSNDESDIGKADQKAIDKELNLRLKKDKKYFVIRQQDYINDNGNNLCASTFMAFKQGGQWNYYSQNTQYDKKNKSYHISQGKQFIQKKSFLSKLSITNTQTQKMQSNETVETTKPQNDNNSCIIS